MVGEGDDNIALRHIARLLQSDETDDEGRVAVFHVRGAATIKISVLLDERKRIRRPVRAQRFDHVEMPNEEHRPLRAAAAEAHDQILILGARPGEREVRVGKSRRLQPRSHGDRRLGAAVLFRAVDLDQLAKNLPRQNVAGR